MLQCSIKYHSDSMLDISINCSLPGLHSGEGGWEGP